MNMQPMKLNNIQTGFKRILLTVATVFMLGNGWAQDAKVLKGRIVNAEGEPIAGAVVNVAEASRIALSDKDGFFTLKNVKPADELYVSSVGYLPATAIADFDENFKIVMDADLDEYAHTTPLPFNRKPKKFVTESTSIVTGEELEKLKTEREEKEWEKLWKTFFTTIAIEQRKNPDCQRNHLPLRFRPLMTEFAAVQPCGDLEPKVR